MQRGDCGEKREKGGLTMWARFFEMGLALWLGFSSFVFNYPNEDPFFIQSDLLAAGFTFLFSLLSFWEPLRKTHLLIFLIAIYLCAVSYSTFPEIALPYQENSIAVGLFLLMLAIVPNRAHLPPRSWREFNSRH